MQKIKIIHSPSEDEPFVILNKPAHLPSAPLKENDENNAFFQACQLFPDLINVKGRKEIEHGLMHRLDTETSGLLLIASSQNFYNFLQTEQNEGRFIKKYRAICDFIPENCQKLGGFPLLNIKSFSDESCQKISSYFRNYGEGLKSVRPVLETSGMAALKKCKSKKLYTTEIKLIKENKNQNKYFFECKIQSGYRHQVRSHLAWINFPVTGDALYNINENTQEKMEFYASEIEFTNPVNKQRLNFKLDFE